MTRTYLALYLPWLVSAVTVWTAVATGDKKVSGWIIGLVGQALWLLWIWASATWGLLPANIVLTLVYIRNLYKWLPASKPADACLGDTQHPRSPFYYPPGGYPVPDNMPADGRLLDKPSVSNVRVVNFPSDGVKIRGTEWRPKEQPDLWPDQYPDVRPTRTHDH